MAKKIAQNAGMDYNTLQLTALESAGGINGVTKDEWIAKVSELADVDIRIARNFMSQYSHALIQYEFVRCDVNTFFLTERGVKAKAEVRIVQKQKLKILTELEKENVQTIISSCEIILSELPEQVRTEKKIFPVSVDSYVIFLNNLRNMMYNKAIICANFRTYFEWTKSFSAEENFKVADPPKVHILYSMGVKEESGNNERNLYFFSTMHPAKAIRATLRQTKSGQGCPSWFDVATSSVSKVHNIVVF